MRRLCLPVLIAMWLGLVALPAQASPARSFPATASATGSATFEASTHPPCLFVASEDGTFAGIGVPKTPLRGGTYHLDVCIQLAGVSFTQSGEFTIATRIGTLSGALSGTETGSDGSYSETLTIEGATGAYLHATGTIQIAGTKTFGTATETWTVTATWTSSINP